MLIRSSRKLRGVANRHSAEETLSVCDVLLPRVRHLLHIITLFVSVHDPPALLCLLPCFSAFGSHRHSNLHQIVTQLSPCGVTAHIKSLQRFWGHTIPRIQNDTGGLMLLWSSMCVALSKTCGITFTEKKKKKIRSLVVIKITT